MSELTVHVVILDFREAGATIRCAEGVLRQKGIGLRVIIVENDAEGANFYRIKEHFAQSDRVFVLSSGENLGYARGNNYGVEWCREQHLDSDYTVIVNNDIDIPDDDTLADLIREYEKFADAGVVSPRIVHFGSGITQGPYREKTFGRYLLEACFPLAIPLRIGKEQRELAAIDRTIPVYRTMGSFMLIRTGLFEAVGLFDPRTFLGSEEDILSYRLRAAGKRFYYAPQHRVWHESGKSSKKLASKKVKNYFRDSTLYFWKEYKGAGTFRLFVLKHCINLYNFYQRTKNRIG